MQQQWNTSGTLADLHSIGAGSALHSQAEERAVGAGEKRPSCGLLKSLGQGRIFSLTEPVALADGYLLPQLCSVRCTI